jgi:subtilisin family serine protease
MHRRILLVAVLAVLASLLPVSAEAGNGAGADRYIVVLKDAVDPTAVADIHAKRYGAAVDHVWGYAIHGYSAAIPNDRVAAVRADANVSYVVADGTASIDAQTLPWGVDKIDADLSSTKAGDGTDSVAGNAYVIDTGIDTSHPDLNVVEFQQYAGGPHKDCNGHGSHVAGTIGAKDNTEGVVGVAPGIPLHAVKVLNCSGSGTWSDVISGINYVAAKAPAGSVANMSLGGPANQAVDDAVQNAAKTVFFAVAAGNSSADACGSSPARAGSGTNNGVATAAATDSADNEASFSNFGACVDIWAPGVNILSTYKGGGYATLSGTSMASPHVAGGAALYLSSPLNTGKSPSQVESALKGAATTPGTRSKDGRAITRENVGGF